MPSSGKYYQLSKKVKMEDNSLEKQLVSLNPYKKIKTVNGESPINLYGPPGVGDLLWLLQKLYPNTDRNFNIFSWDRETISSPMLLGLERINSVQNFKAPFRTYSQFKTFCTEKYESYKKMTPEQINRLDDIYLEANTFLENGNRLEDYLPNLNTQFSMPWKEDEIQNERVSDLINDMNTILIYTSSAKNNGVRSLMGNWNINYWIKLISMIFKTFPTIKIVWIGSNYDTDAMNLIKKEFPNELISYYVDEPIEFLLPLMKQCKCFLSYQSGLSCISMSERIPTFMFYFSNLKKLPYSICPPESINNKSIYNPVFFDNVKIDEVLRWIDPHLSY